MTPEPDTGFAARCRVVCPRFRAIEMLPARKSELLAGDVDGTPVVAKRLVRPNRVWAWYFAREVAIYRAFAASPPPVRTPRLIAADTEVLVVERLPGAPLATRRSPQAVLDEPVLHELIAIHHRFATWSGALPRNRPPPAVRTQLRSRFLEDPTASVAWIRDGVERAGRRELLPAAAVPRIVERIDAYPMIVTSHGDLLLRNAISDGASIGIVDWECAGPHLAEWDLALLWTQLGPAQRPVVEAGRSPAFLGLVAFALAREVSYLHAFAASPRRATLARLTSELADVCARLE